MVKWRKWNDEKPRKDNGIVIIRSGIHYFMISYHDCFWHCEGTGVRLNDDLFCDKVEWHYDEE